MSAMDSSSQRALEELGRCLEEHGFRFRAAPYFGSSGIAVFTPPVQSGSHRDISVIERGVFLYASGDGWEARVTRHGGPHWTRSADTIADLEEIALEALRATEVPPNLNWRSTRP
jgi:hypothetical protein